MHYGMLMQLIKARNDKRSVAMIINLANGAERLVDRAKAKDDLLADDIEAAFRFDRSGTVKIGDAEYFINVYNPPLNLIIVGAVHLAQALIPLARAAGYDVAVIDPRAAFASQERFPDVSVHSEWPDEPDRSLRDYRIVAYPTSRGCAAAYFPEANVLIPLASTALGSNTPVSKAIVVRLEKMREFR